jgi:hypothetical protein
MQKDIHTLCEDLCITVLASATEAELQEGGFDALHKIGDSSLGSSSAAGSQASSQNGVDVVTLPSGQGRVYENGLRFEVCIL